MNHCPAFTIRPLKLILCLAAFALCQPLLAADFHVAPDGDDGNSGTLEEPLATIQAARDAVRAEIASGMSADITVYLGAGDYFIEQPVVFDDRDSGRDGFTITYQGAPNLQSRIYGGRRITNWTQLNNTEYAADVPDVQQHHTLYENDRSANGGSFHVFQDATEGNWRKSGTQLIYHPRSLPIEDQVVVLGTTKDVFVVMGRSMGQIVSNLVFDGLHMIGSRFTGTWYDGATGNGTWDGDYNGEAWGGRRLGDAVIRPDMRHGQFVIENARNVTIRNSKLYGAGFMAVMFNRWAQENRVENCWIEMAGCNGLFFMGWECGRGPFATVAESYVNKQNVVRNNVFHDIGRFAHDGAGIYLTFSGDNLVEHNVFRGITRYGVSQKGWRPQLINVFFHYDLMPVRDLENEPAYDATWVTFYDGYVVTQANQGAELQHSRNNLVRYNDLSQIARTGSDMGMIEMWGAGTNNVWEYNALHDGVNTGGWDDWMHGLFNDDGSHQATLRGNVMYWLAGGGRSRAVMAKGNDQNNIHNIIADCDLSAAATIGPFVEEAHGMIWSHNIVAAKIGALTEGGYGTETVGGMTYPILQAAEKNLYFYKPIDPAESSASGAVNIQGQVASRNGAGGIDSDSIYADPRFDRQSPWWDAHHTDYRLLPDSPALGLGFQETDMSLIGLQAGFPFDLTEILGSPANRIRLAADFSRIFKNRITNQQVKSRSSVPLYQDSWTRYDGVDFGSGQYDQFRAHLQWATSAQNQGTAIEIRLDAPDGTLIGTVPLGQDTCRIATTSGLHDLFLVFPNENVQSMDWFVFQPRIIWSGGGSDDNWTTSENWSSPVTAGEPVYFAASGRTSPNNDFPAGTSVAGITFDVDAPAYTLGGNGIALTGNLVNSSANDQVITLPVTLAGAGQIQMDTGARRVTLGGSLSGAGGGITKTGTGTLTLGAISYTGDTTVESGTLVFTQAGLSRLSNVWIGTTAGAGAVLDLNHGLTERVGALYIDGVPMPDGTYGSSDSDATHKDDTAFRGTGMLALQSGPCPPAYSTRSDGYTVATFYGAGSGTWTVPAGVTNVEVLVVGGGGSGSAGGTWTADGGGGGGFYSTDNYSVTSGESVAISVGAGGAATTAYGSGDTGDDSVFDRIIAYGGQGAVYTGDQSHIGGTSGGYSTDGGITITAGNVGGGPSSANGGGGAGAVGNTGGFGGDSSAGIGLQSDISGTSTYYAGGGGGGYSGAVNLGGLGGGGKGATDGEPGYGHDGVDDSGGGGGASRDNVTSGAGGSGIVIVAYQSSATTTYTVNFVSNGGSAVADQTVAEGLAATLPAPSPTRTGYTFVEWCSDSGLTTAFDFATVITADTTLYANWAVGSYTLTYNGGLNGFISGTTPQSVEYGGSGTTVTAVADSGYRFIKWSDNSTANPRTDGNVSADITVTASFELVSTDTITPTTVTTRGDGKTVATFSTTGSGTWTIPAGVTEVEVLVVGGGASGSAGGTWTADGGGAGGFYDTNSYSVTPGSSISVAVGAGGAATTAYGSGNAGSNSVFGQIIAYGGQGPVYTGNQSHFGGTSGGYSTDGGGTITAGNVGGGASSANGGGGTGAVGNTGGFGGDSSGGIGLQCDITGTLTYYAGGGGGGYGGAVNLGGLGGGGKGATDGEPGYGHDGVDGLGGGGGGSRDNVTSGSGGSGVVIVAYMAAVGGNYSTWASANGVTGGPDVVGPGGIPNLLLYALDLKLDGTNGSAGTLSGTLLSFTKRAEAVANGDVSYAIEESDDLGVTDPWTEVTGYTANNATTISYTLPAGKARTFARLVVVPIP